MATKKQVEEIWEKAGRNEVLTPEEWAIYESEVERRRNQNAGVATEEPEATETTEITEEAHEADAEVEEVPAEEQGETE